MKRVAARAIRAYRMRTAARDGYSRWLREEEARSEEWRARIDALAADLDRLLVNAPV